MQANNFDEAIRQRFDAYEPVYDPASWEALAARLPVAKSTRKFLLLPIGIGVAASVAACIFFFRTVSPDHSLISTAARQSASAVPVNQPSALAPIVSLPRSTAFSENTAPATAVKHGDAMIHPKTIVPASSGQTIARVQQTDTIAPGIIAEKEKEQIAVAVVQANNKPNLYDEVTKPDEKSATPKTIISLAGGVQYGSLNTGYTAGLQVRHNLSPRWYVETEIGYLSYTASGARNVSPTEYDMIVKTGHSDHTALGVQSENSPRQVVQYIQAAPGLGFNVTRSFSVGAGVDVQRALQNGDGEPVQVEGENAKVLPILDIGATGRITIRISGRLEASLLYRQGVNNLLKADQSYLDRQYMQVQLKVPLLRR